MSAAAARRAWDRPRYERDAAQDTAAARAGAFRGPAAERRSYARAALRDGCTTPAAVAAYVAGATGECSEWTATETLRELARLGQAAFAGGAWTATGRR